VSAWKAPWISISPSEQHPSSFLPPCCALFLQKFVFVRSKRGK
jgi:hypothetical protein